MQTFKYRFKYLIFCLVILLALTIVMSRYEFRDGRLVFHSSRLSLPWTQGFESSSTQQRSIKTPSPNEKEYKNYKIADEENDSINGEESKKPGSEFDDGDSGNAVKSAIHVVEEDDDRPDVVKFITPAPMPADVPDGKKKLIYFASSFFGGSFSFSELPSQCRTTRDPADLKKADAVVVHALGGSPLQDMHSLEGRRKLGVPYDQVWVGLMYESPGIYSALPGVYNYTMTFRRDSDIYSPYCGRFELSSKTESISERESSLEGFRKSRTKKVAWMVSNCHVPNLRMEYAKELSKHISVDIYGACSPNGLKCVRFSSGPSDRSCWEMIAKNYKFYLSFESSHCKDYITEKFFSPMYYGVLPIVYGASSVEDYRAMAPKHSYIDTRDFPSPKELAKFLNKLDESPEEYESYFAWRKRYMIHYNRTFVGQDLLCSKLWNLDKNRHSYTKKELSEWWLEGGKCVPPPWKPEGVRFDSNHRPMRI